MADKVFKDFEAFVEKFNKCRANDGTAYSKLLSDVLELLKSQQAEIERLKPKKGQWDYGTQCSVCKGTIIPPKDRKVRIYFCPWCGANMREGDGDG